MQQREFVWTIRSWMLRRFKKCSPHRSKTGSDQDRISAYIPFLFSQTLPLPYKKNLALERVYPGPVYLFLLSAAAAASLIAWWAASGAQAMHSTTWSWSRSSHLQNRAINVFSPFHPTIKVFKEIVLIFQDMHTNYQVLTNFVCFSILYFYLFSFLFISCLFYITCPWFDESVSGGIEQIEIDITQLEPLSLAYMETQWGLKLVGTPEQLKNYAGFLLVGHY